MEKKQIKVTGMMCKHCEAHVKSALEALDGVKSASADHKAGTVTVKLSAPVEDPALAAAVREAGYEPTEIKKL